VTAVGAFELAAVWREGGFRGVEIAEQTSVVYVGVLEVRLAIYALQHPRGHFAPALTVRGEARSGCTVNGLVLV
jgi:hypothetical protein